MESLMSNCDKLCINDKKILPIKKVKCTELYCYTKMYEFDRRVFTELIKIAIFLLSRARGTITRGE